VRIKTLPNIFGAPLSGLGPLRSCTQGVALGWLVAGLWPSATYDQRATSSSELSVTSLSMNPW